MAIYRKLIIFICIIIHVSLLLWAAWTNFVTIDEVGHISAGVSYWRTGRFRIYRVNPPLPRMIATLPVMAMRPATDNRRFTEAPGDRPEWLVGEDFAEVNRANYMTLVRLGRLAGVFWSILGAWAVYRWSRDLYGASAGCLGLILWCFEPTILAHAGLITTDLPAAVSGLVATYAFWRYLQSPSWRGASICGLLLGLAQLTKHSMLFLYGLWPLFWLIQTWGSSPTARRLTWRVTLAQAATVIGISLLVLNAGYGFSGTGQRLGSFAFVSHRMSDTGADWGSTRTVGNRFADTWLGSIPVPLPADYLGGMDEQARDFEGRFASYLGGVWRSSGWSDFYLYALAVKWPLGLWGLVLLNVGLTLSGRLPRLSMREEGLLWLAFAVPFALISSQVGMTLHFRYVLPSLPFLLVSTSKLAVLLQLRWRTFIGVTALLLACDIASVLSVAPHWISYFNEAIGGPMHGHDHLIDSNIDWGQDILNLKRWLDAHPEARPLHMAVFHDLDPVKFGIEFDLPPPAPVDRSQTPQVGSRITLTPGYYAVSVNLLRGVIAPIPDGKGGSYWTPNRETFAYFLRYRPIARAGYSIYIYKIN